VLATQQSLSVEDIEIDLLLEGIFRQYGFDFRKYARSALRRRVRNFIRDEQIGSVSLLQDRILHDRQWLDRFVCSLSVNVSAMFRDAQFYVTFRRGVVPLLRTYPFSRIWVAGVSAGEDLYSLAIVLEEEGIHDRCRIYATDINDAILKRAKDGIYSLDLIKSYTNNYIRAGGKRLFFGSLHRGLRTRNYELIVAGPHCVRATQSRLRCIVQRISRNLLPKRDDLFQQRTSGSRFQSFT